LCLQLHGVIEEFLLGQVAENEGGEEALTAATLMIHSLNTGRDKRDACVQTLCKYIDNIIGNDVKEEKYRKLRVNNKVLQVCCFVLKRHL
jgi:hypothetical protein